MSTEDHKEQTSWEENIASESSLSEEKYLFVPIHMDVLKVGKQNKKASWKFIKPEYKNLLDKFKGRGLGKSIETSLSKQPSQKGPDPGIHLHWILPKAFRHGEQLENDPEPRFPLIPNRWLIIRTNIKDDKTLKLEQKTWIVESDSKNSNGQKNWITLNQKKPGPTLVPNEDEFEVGNIGKVAAFDANQWEDDPSRPLFLTIMAPGNPAFAASYPSSKNILGFHDNMDNTESGKYTYLVCGWYSNPAADPLNQLKDSEEWINKMKAFSWQLKDISIGKTLELPKRLLCHTMVYEVDWKGKEKIYDYKVPDEELAKIGIGNSGSEAMAALVRYNMGSSDKQKTIDTLLAAFQFNQLSKYESDAGLLALKEQIHAQGFHPFDGGSLWLIERKEEDNLNEKSTQLSDLKPFPEDISKLLNTINTDQEKYDKCLNELRAIQSQTYADWFKKIWIALEKDDEDDEDEKPDTKQVIKQILSSIKKHKEDIEKLKNKIGGLKLQMVTDDSADTEKKRSLKEELETQTGTIPKNLLMLTELLESEKYKALNLCVKASKMPRYHMANDLSVVITGMEGSGKYKEDGHLLCRLEDQLIDTISIENEGIPSTKIHDDFSFLANAHIPNGIKKVYQESILRDPLLSELIAKKSNINQNLVKLTKEIKDYIQNPDSSRFFNSTDPAVLPPGFSACMAVQPWTPLFLEWEVEWEPAYSKIEAVSSLEAINWTLGKSKDGFLNNIDYTYHEPQVAVTTPTKFTFRGRVLVSLAHQDSVQSLFQSLPSLNNLRVIDPFKPLSQTISGFSNNLIMRENSIQLPPVEFKDGKLKIDELVTSIGNQYYWNPVPEQQGFFPIQAGNLSLKKLRVIDSFGQNCTITPDPDLQKNDSLLLFSGSLEVKEGKIRLPVRISQPSRLRFKWLSTLKDDQETNADPGTTPVLGWLLPHKLEKSILIFDPNGFFWGQIRLRDIQVQVFKNEDSTKNNIALDNFISSLGKDAYEDLLKLIDELDEKGLNKAAGNTLGLTIPIGNPIALVRASIKLELREPPVQDQAYTLKSNNPYANIEFPVTLGDARKKTDGLIGYFINEDFKKMYLPFAKDASDLVDAENYFEPNHQLKLIAKDETQLAKDETQLTLLMDPRFGIHVNSGILPSGFYELPPHVLTRAINNFELSFLVSPILTYRNNIQIPLPKIEDKQWAWASPSEKDGVDYDEQQIDAETAKGLLFEPLQLKEGWLLLKQTKK